MKDCGLKLISQADSERVSKPVSKPEDLLSSLLYAICSRWDELPLYLHLSFVRLVHVDSELQSLASIHNIAWRSLQPASFPAGTSWSLNQQKKCTKTTHAILHCMHHYLGKSKMIDLPTPSKKQLPKTKRPDSILLARSRQSAQNTSNRLFPLQERDPNSQQSYPIPDTPAVPQTVGTNENMGSWTPAYENDASAGLGDGAYFGDTAQNFDGLPNESLANGTLGTNMDWDFSANFNPTT